MSLARAGLRRGPGGWGRESCSGFIFEFAKSHATSPLPAPPALVAGRFPPSGEGVSRTVRAHGDSCGRIERGNCESTLTPIRAHPAFPAFMSSRLFRSCMLLAVALLMAVGPVAWAFGASDDDDSQMGMEYQIKAAFLFNFAKFVDWPSRKFTQPDSPLLIGIVGEDPFGGLLEEAVQDKRINDRAVAIRHIDTMEELRKCHIIFVCRSEEERLGPILSEVRGDNVLTVGETDKFISKGGMINFVMIGSSVHFQINDSAARHAGLKISSKLSSLALPSQ